MMSTEEMSPGVSEPAPKASSTDSPPLQELMAQWLPALSEAAKRYHRRDNSNAVLSMLGVPVAGATACLILLQGRVSGWEMAGIIPLVAILGFGVGLLLNGILYLILLKPLLKDQKDQIAEIQAAIAQHNLPSAKIVRGIAAEIKSSEYRDDVMRAIDPTEATLILDHDKVLALLQAFSEAIPGTVEIYEKLGQVAELQNYAYSYAKVGLYAEAIEILSMAELLYKVIGTAVPQVQWLKDNMVLQADAPWVDFSFRDQVSWLSNIVARRKAVAQALEVLQATAGQAEVTDLLDVDQGIDIEIRDKEIFLKWVEIATKFGLAVLADLEAILTLSYVPGGSAILSLATTALFDKNPSVLPLIEACIRRGAEMKSTLLNLLKGDNVNERSNAALALGIMRSAEGAKAAQDYLESNTDPLTRIGALFILARAGEPERQQEILPYLDDPDITTAHAAAIALEHLLLPVPDPVLEKHLRSKHWPVRLRLARHVGRQTEVSPGVRDAVLELVTDKDDGVGMAAAETMTALLSGDALFDLAQHTLSRREYPNIRRRQMLMVGRSRTEGAVDLLLREWQAASRATFDSGKEYASHILKCLGDTRSPRVVPALVKAMGNKDYKVPALNALIAVARQHPGEIRPPGYFTFTDDVTRQFVLALLSNDAADIEAFKRALTLASGKDRGLALQLAAVLAHPALEKTLDDLRTSDKGNAVEKPTWRYLATRASFAVLMRKTAA